MARVVRYLTHPQVNIDPAVPVPEWGLSDLGRARTEALATSGALAKTRTIVSSGEQKAIETAEILSRANGALVIVRSEMHENDRSATGFLPGPEFEAVADAFFANPDQSVRGWETARHAQHRVHSQFEAVLEHTPAGDLLFVGHGGVGTLLYCQLAGLPISGAHDQGGGGGGCYFTLGSDGKPLHACRPMERLYSEKPY